MWSSSIAHSLVQSVWVTVGNDYVTGWAQCPTCQGQTEFGKGCACGAAVVRRPRESFTESEWERKLMWEDIINGGNWRRVGNRARLWWVTGPPALN